MPNYGRIPRSEARTAAPNSKGGMMRPFLYLAMAALSLSAFARDYATPATRLVGRWQSTSAKLAVKECRYFGPVEEETRTGLAVLYQLDDATGKWNRFDARYRIEKDDATRSRVSITLIAPDGKIPEEHAIGARGATSTALIRSKGQFFAAEIQYID